MTNTTYVMLHQKGLVGTFRTKNESWYIPCHSTTFGIFRVTVPLKKWCETYQQQELVRNVPKTEIGATMRKA